MLIWTSRFCINGWSHLEDFDTLFKLDISWASGSGRDICLGPEFREHRVSEGQESWSFLQSDSAAYCAALSLPLCLSCHLGYRQCRPTIDWANKNDNFFRASTRYLTAPKIWADCEWVELLMAGAALALHSGSSAEAESPVARAVPEWCGCRPP